MGHITRSLFLLKAYQSTAHILSHAQGCVAVLGNMNTHARGKLRANAPYKGTYEGTYKDTYNNTYKDTFTDTHVDSCWANAP